MSRTILASLVYLLSFFLVLAAPTGCGDPDDSGNGQENGEEQNGNDEEQNQNGDDLENGDAEDTEDPCTFNSDCIETERCECDIDEGCFCRIGPRGEGASGVDTCQDGNDCETSLCMEGPEDVLYCSGPCEGDEDCGPALPVCADIAFLGRVCIRDSNG